MSSIGGGLGYLLSDQAAKHLSFFKQPNRALDPDVAFGQLEKRKAIAKVVLPLLSGTALMLAERYREKMNQEYSKVKGYKERK